VSDGAVLAVLSPTRRIWEVWALCQFVTALPFSKAKARISPRPEHLSAGFATARFLQQRKTRSVMAEMRSHFETAPSSAKSLSVDRRVLIPTTVRKSIRIKFLTPLSLT
jgi:hypothetical protein